MKNRMVGMLALSLMAAIGLTAPANASELPIEFESVETGNSFTVRLLHNVNASGLTISGVAVQIVSAAPGEQFSSPGISVLSGFLTPGGPLAGWSQTPVAAHLQHNTVLATGTPFSGGPFSQMYTDIHFEGNASDYAPVFFGGGGHTLELNIVWFDAAGDAVLSKSASLSWLDTQFTQFVWSLHNGSWDPTIELLTIPLPAPVWMGLAGLLGIAALRRRSPS